MSFAVASTLQIETVVESPFFVLGVVFQGVYGGCVAFPGSSHDGRAALSRRLDEDAQAIPVQLQVRLFQLSGNVSHRGFKFCGFMNISKRCDNSYLNRKQADE